ncbi:hypothetical protein NPIL_273411 [Nephila pilipes]|uniref:Uncharacterized protein n=2 Tax=Nephila pilipes TaxID=299642 RepID=A0A8X6U270_NEPPI|nr:hypothetical protein NPIL_273411 [Nephila pilipes]
MEYPTITAVRLPESRFLGHLRSPRQLLASSKQKMKLNMKFCLVLLMVAVMYVAAEPEPEPEPHEGDMESLTLEYRQLEVSGLWRGDPFLGKLGSPPPY